MLRRKSSIEVFKMRPIKDCLTKATRSSYPVSYMSKDTYSGYFYLSRKKQ